MRPGRSVILTVIIIWAAAVAWAAVAARRGGHHSPPVPRTLTAEIPAAALTHVDLQARDGDVDVRPRADAASDSVTVRVDVRPAYSSGIQIGPPVGDPADVALDFPIDGHTLRLALTGQRLNGLETSWRIEVPARFSAGIDVSRGRVKVEGLTGGLRVWLGAGRSHDGGELLVDVPRGSLDLSVDVGDVDARTAAPEFGAVNVSARVGDAFLQLNGHDIRTPHAPGPGHEISLDGSPNLPKLRVRAGVGEARLRIR